MDQAALVTGANGFIGRHLVQQLLDSGWRVGGIVHRSRGHALALLSSGDIFETPRTTEEAMEIVEKFRPDAIFHLAAATAVEGPGDVDGLLTANFMLGAMLMEAACGSPAKPSFLMAGSFWEFGTGPSYAPNTLYAATKHCLFDLLVYFRARRDLRALSLVLFDTYGPDDPRDKIWNRILNAEAGSRVAMTRGEQLVELVHVRDVVSAFTLAAGLLAAGQPAESAYAVRSRAPASLRDTVEAICETTGRRPILEWGALPYRETEIFTPWSGPLLPGWAPQVTLEAGIGELLRMKDRGAGLTIHRGPDLSAT